MANEVKKKDSDLPYVLIGCGIFTLVLLIVDFTYGNMNALLHSWVKLPFAILHIIISALWAIIIIEIDNPNFDIYRKWLLAATIATLLLILGHRAGFISDKMFKEDVNKNKQEQSE